MATDLIRKCNRPAALPRDEVTIRCRPAPRSAVASTIDPVYTGRMTEKLDPDRALRTRHLITCALFTAVVLANLGLSLLFNASRRAQIEKLTQQNAETQSRIDEVKSILSEVDQLRKQASELNSQTEKIASEMRRPMTGQQVRPSGSGK
jgi:hypothetical protein